MAMPGMSDERHRVASALGRGVAGRPAPRRLARFCRSRFAMQSLTSSAVYAVSTLIHGVPAVSAGPRSRSAESRVPARLYTRIDPNIPAWNTRTTRHADHLEQRQERDDEVLARVGVGEQVLEAAGLGLRSRASSCSMRASIEICAPGMATFGRCLARSSTALNAAMRLKRSTSTSVSYSSPAMSATRWSGRCHWALRSCLALVQQVRRRP